MSSNTTGKPIPKYLLVPVILLVTIAVIIGAWRVATDKPTPIANPLQLYTTSLAEIPTYYRVDGIQTFYMQNSDITESYCKYIVTEGAGTEYPRIYIDETLSIGSHEIQSIRLYYQGTEYLTIQGTDFKSAATAEEFQKKYTPYTVLTPALYSEISGISTKAGSEITFSGATAAEEWASVEGMEFTNASGKAFINKDGQLIKSLYELEYSIQETFYELSLTVTPISTAAPEIYEPDDSVYQEIADIEVPVTIEKACGYLSATPYLYAEYEDMISCQAFGDDRMQIVTLEINEGEDWYAKMVTDITTANTSKAGVVNTNTKTELFHNGSYSVSVNDGTPVPNPDIDKDAMQAHGQNLLIGTIILPQDIVSFEFSESIADGFVYLEFQASEAFANALAAEACNTLYQSPSILDELAESYTTNTATCYLTLERTTGFPYAAGFNYSGTHTISGIPYELSFYADQSYMPIQYIIPEVDEESKAELPEIDETAPTE